MDAGLEEKIGRDRKGREGRRFETRRDNSVG